MFFTKKFASILSILLLAMASTLKAEPKPIGLLGLEKALVNDLKLINYPPEPIKELEDPYSTDPIYDVAIVGAGMAGLAAAAALFKEGVFHLRLFDQNPEGLEGPWLTYARMHTLRSKKEEMGPALDIPHLTFKAWYEAQYGLSNWNKMDKIPTKLWMEYLSWFKHVMHLPVENDCLLVSIIPTSEHFLLEFIRQGQPYQVKALKIVLATGRGGFGGPKIPASIRNLPKKSYAHVMESIDFNSLKNKKIAVVGAGSSAFDAAATALETGAAKVDLIMRTACLPCVNKFSGLPEHCFGLSFYKQTEEWRWKVMNHALNCTIPPPEDALKRVQPYKNFSVLSARTILRAQAKNDTVELVTNRGTLKYDFLILGTGYDINGNNQSELSQINFNILLWKDRFPCGVNHCSSNFGQFPYLGPSFELVEKVPGQAPYLKNIYCFNFASMMSHGKLCSEIVFLSLGAVRLAEGIASDFLQQQSEAYLKELEEYSEADFDLDEFIYPLAS